jgi:ferrochelatase
MKTGVLLLQLGTPDSPDVPDVRRYLAEFLGDPRVVDLPSPIRWLLLHGVILRVRPRRTAEAYAQIWTEHGSPLLLHTQALAAAVAERLGDGFRVAVGMRYGNPTIGGAVERLVQEGCDRLVILPLFPQYSAAATGSALEAAMREVATRWNVPAVTTIVDFYDHPGFVDAVASVARPLIESHRPDHVVFSYHGLPERQVRRSGPGWCLEQDDCCRQVGDANRFCYRAQCHATTAALVEELGLDVPYTTAFQSRLPGQRWITPYTDRELDRLHREGVRRPAILTPSFTADCLETLEEIGIRARQQWQELGGDELLVVPCVNASDVWADAVCDLVRR